MGAEGAWIPLVMNALGVAGTVANVYNTQKTAKRQDNQLASQIQQQGVRQSEADAEVARALQERSASDSATERATTGAQYLDQVRAAQGAATRGLGQAGAVSSAYRDSASDAAMGVSDYGARTADLMARIDAPAQQRQREVDRAGQLGVDLGLTGRRAMGDNFLAQLKLQGIRRDPWIDAAGSLASGMSSALGAGGGNAGAGMGQGSTRQFGNQAGTWFNDPSLWGR